MIAKCIICGYDFNRLGSRKCCSDECSWARKKVTEHSKYHSKPRRTKDEYWIAYRRNVILGELLE